MGAIPNDPEKAGGHLPAVQQVDARTTGYDAVLCRPLDRSSDRLDLRRSRDVWEVQSAARRRGRRDHDRRPQATQGRRARERLAPLLPGQGLPGHDGQRAGIAARAEGRHDGRQPPGPAGSQRPEGVPGAHRADARGSAERRRTAAGCPDRGGFRYEGRPRGLAHAARCAARRRVPGDRRARRRPVDRPGSGRHPRSELRRGLRPGHDDGCGNADEPSHGHGRGGGLNPQRPGAVRRGRHLAHQSRHAGRRGANRAPGGGPQHHQRHPRRPL